MRITNGEVGYGRTVKTGDFENKRVDVKLSFAVEEGEDYHVILSEAAKEAHDKAHAMLGIKKPDAVVTAAQVEQQMAAAATPEPRKPGRPPGTTKPKTAEDLRTAAVARAEAVAEPDVEGFDEDAPESQPEVSDVALSTAMNRKVAQLKDKHGGAAPKIIKDLINTFVAPPKKSVDIPQNLRQQFLTKLEALQ